MKEFLQKHITLVSLVAVTALTGMFTLGALFIGATELREKAFFRVDQTAVDASKLPGKQNEISDRSKLEIKTVLEPNPYVIGAYVTKLSFEKTENPVIYYFAKDQIMDTFMLDYDSQQRTGKGQSSAELSASNPQSLRNSEESRSGLIKCDLLSSTNIGKTTPGIDKKVKGVCRATIPPFEDEVNMAVMVLITLKGDESSDEIQKIRRLLLQLQIDIYNRDFQGRETWAHP